MNDLAAICREAAMDLLFWLARRVPRGYRLRGVLVVSAIWLATPDRRAAAIDYLLATERRLAWRERLAADRR